MTKVKQVVILSALLLLLCHTSHGQQPKYDLAIENVRVFDSKTRKTYRKRTILINADTIVAIVKARRRISSAKTIKGNNRLAIPGFIDTHTHMRNVYGTLDEVEKRGTGLDRKKLADTYLRYGTTTIVDMGQPEKWLDTTLGWEKAPAPQYPNVFVSGGAMISEEPGRAVYMNHVMVKTPEEARAKVREYSNKGLEHIKIYSRLRQPEMEAAISEGLRQNLTISAHIDNNVTSIPNAIDLGVRNIEHMLALPPAVINLEEQRAAMRKKYGLGAVSNSDQFLAQVLFFFRYVKENPEWDAKLETLFDKMAADSVTLSTTIHIMASVAQRSYFFTSLTLHQDTLSLGGFTQSQKAELGKCYDIALKYLKSAHDKGVKLRIGTDCQDGGKAMLSELLLLHEAGFKTEDIIQIATYNGAKAMRIDNQFGSIEQGKKADLVLFDKNPFDDYRNFLSQKTVIKGGQLFEDK